MKTKSLVVDSDVLIWFLRGKETVVSKLFDLLSSQNVMISTISIAEIYAGSREKEKQTIREFLSLFDVIDVTSEIAVKAGEYMKKYSKSHSVELADACIGATVNILSATLWTYNLKHYPMLKTRQFFIT